VFARSDGNFLALDAAVATLCRDTGVVGFELERPHVEDDLASFRAFGLDGAGDDVPRREVALRMVLVHEPFAVAVSQHRALAPQRFGEQERILACIGRRMELHVLHVLDVSAGERGHRDAVASRVVGVGRPAVERADATGRGTVAPA